MINLENLENLEVAGFSRFMAETWKTWKTPYFQVYRRAHSKRARVQARGIGISLREILSPVDVFQVSAKTKQRPMPYGRRCSAFAQ